jgi:hypothetical protein
VHEWLANAPHFPVLIAWSIFLPCVFSAAVAEPDLISFSLEFFLMSGIVMTGNYAWINFLGFLPFLSSLDDDFFAVRVLAPAPIASDDSKSDFPRRGLFVMLFRVVGWLRSFLSFGLLFVILRQSVHPVKELFADQPWLHHYDPYFLVNSNGLFGFVNRERVVVTLEFTQAPVVAKTACTDHAQAIGSHPQTRTALFCDDVVDMCGTHEQVDSLCGRSCGLCVGPEDIKEWTEIDFKNLPG